jgi:hypothetical protein
MMYFACAVASLLLLGDVDSLSLLDQVAASGRCFTVAESPDARVSPPHLVAPGQPPLLSFRVYEGKGRGRFSNTDLMLDDAGH